MIRRRKHEPTQPKNPRQLTIGQHIHSRWCINKFADDAGRVAVLRQGQPTPFLTKPDNDVFCAKRVWGQNLEEGLFSKLEQAFHSAVEGILATGAVVDHRAITEYVSLWRIRAQLAEEPPDDVVLNGISGSSLTKDQEEIVEKKGGMFARDGGVVPGRFGAFLDALRKHAIAMSGLGGIEWGILRARDCAGFICGDRPGNDLYIPIAPSVALVAGYEDLEVGSITVDDLNQSSQKQARSFVFGHPDDIAAFVARSESGTAR
ncbi:MAG: hypothetical protein WDO74_04495 [Pseudomonadota bacterium]